jgi:hypothetical protein
MDTSANPQNSAQPYYFLHIHKTAGVTFNYSVLPQWFGTEETCPPWSYTDLLKIPLDQLARYRLFRGHFYYSLLRYLPFRPLCMTFLRDPIERLLSLYSYIRRMSDNPVHQRVCAMRGFSEFAWDPQLASPNFQVLSLTGDVDVAELHGSYHARSAEPYDFDVLVMEELTKHVPVWADLELAKRRLAEFVFVGLTERFAESVELLQRTAGWKPLSPYNNLNAAPSEERVRRDQIPPEELRALMDRHGLDLELYAYACQLLDRRRAMLAGSVEL